MVSLTFSRRLPHSSIYIHTSILAVHTPVLYNLQVAAPSTCSHAPLKHLHCIHDGARTRDDQSRVESKPSLVVHGQLPTTHRCLDYGATARPAKQNEREAVVIHSGAWNGLARSIDQFPD